MMFVALLGATFLISLAVCFIVARIFRKPVDSILERLVPDAISHAWSKYLRFAIYVTGISSGVNFRKVEQYITAPHKDAHIVELTHLHWVLEVCRTVIETLQGIAWMLLVFFLFALIAYVIRRVFEFKPHGK